jgi:hypothetical protein
MTVRKFLWGTIAVSWGLAILELFGCATVGSVPETHTQCVGGYATTPTGDKFYADCK